MALISHGFDRSLLKRLHSEVHIWYCEPEKNREASTISACKSVLSAQEIKRYKRFRFDKDRHSYLVSHALLRHALSKYFTINASQWQFECSAHGKPELVQHAGVSDVMAAGTSAVDSTAANASIANIRFNLTHTNGLSACVITLNRVCGIDVENIHRQNSLAGVAQRMFAEEELAVLHKNVKDSYRFYDFWTLREAYVKALGTGLAGSSKAYYFSLNAGGRTASINFRDKRQAENSQWRFFLFEPSHEHRLAVAFESAEIMPVYISVLDFE